MRKILICAGISYKVGDSIGIRCPNPSDVVEFMIKRLDLDGNNMFTTEDGDEHVQSIEEAFTKRFNLTVVPKKSALRHLACYCTDEKEKFILLNLSSKSGAVNYQVVNILRLSLMFVEICDGAKANRARSIGNVSVMSSSIRPYVVHFTCTLSQILFDCVITFITAKSPQDCVYGCRLYCRRDEHCP